MATRRKRSSSRTQIVTELKRGLRANGSELRKLDVGRELDTKYGLGKVLAIDIGKRVFYDASIDALLMENNEQRDARKRHRR